MPEEPSEKSSQRLHVMGEQNTPEVVMQLQVCRYRGGRIGRRDADASRRRRWRRWGRVERADDEDVDVVGQNVAKEVVDRATLVKVFEDDDLGRCDVWSVRGRYSSPEEFSKLVQVIHLFK